MQFINLSRYYYGMRSDGADNEPFSNGAWPAVSCGTGKRQDP